MYRVGIDIDGCINDFSSLIYKYAKIFNEDYGIFKDFDMSDYLIERFFGWSEYTNNEFWIKFYSQALLNTAPLPHAVETIAAIKKNNMKIYIITARKEMYRNLTAEWLKKYNIYYDELIMEQDKADVCELNNIDIMIEDEPENCAAISKLIPVLCMAYPYNKPIRDKKNIIHVSNWSEINNELAKLIYKEVM